MKLVQERSTESAKIIFKNNNKYSCNISIHRYDVECGACLMQ